MYIEKIYDLGWLRTVEKYYQWNYGAPGHSRAGRERPTPMAMEKLNLKRKAQHLQRLIIRNFSPGDWYLTITYRKEERPADAAEAKEDLRIFKRKLKAKFKKQGLEFKWISTTEIGSRGACHHHMLVNYIDMRLITECWSKGYVRAESIYEDGFYEALSEYFVKPETKGVVGGASYSRSRNLVDVEPQIIKRRSRRWNPEPRPPKGWELLKDSLINDFNPITEFPFQKYILRKIEPPRRKRKEVLQP